jgi:hypothetical protein
MASRIKTLLAVVPYRQAVSDHGGRVCAVVPAPYDEASKGKAATLLERVYRRKEKALGPPALEEIDGVLLVAAWFRRRVEERRRTLEVIKFRSP